eukprot:6492765-Amphidinium_carterae.2
MFSAQLKCSLFWPVLECIKLNTWCVSGRTQESQDRTEPLVFLNIDVIEFTSLQQMLWVFCMKDLALHNQLAQLVSSAATGTLCNRCWQEKELRMGVENGSWASLGTVA